MIYLGDNKLGSIYSGENKVDKIYKGEELVYSSGYKPPAGYVLATDDDFSGTRDGYFRYIGKDKYIILPLSIKGVTLKALGREYKSGRYNNIQNYDPMFTDGEFNRSTIIGIGTQPGHSITNMTSMYRMSWYHYPVIDLRHFDASNVNRTDFMFAVFSMNDTVTVYARNAEDASKYRNSRGKRYNVSIITP